MKALMAGLVMAMSFASMGFAADEVVLTAEQKLEVTGFTKKSENDYSIVYKFRDKEKYTVSKERFVSRAHAINFCTELDLILSEPDAVLLMAMSGAALADDFLTEAIVIDIKVGKNKIGGIGGWYNVLGNNDIFMLRNGNGTELEQTELAPFNKGLAARGVPTLTFPAICSEPPLK